MQKLPPPGVCEKCRPPQRFDPFCDRLARDIRNGLSIAFIESLKHRDPEYLAAESRRWLAAQPAAAAYRGYIASRRRHLRRLFIRYQDAWSTDPLVQTVWLWNAGLFFEVHEILEDRWHCMTGQRRDAFKALIQAAGAYVHWQAGRRLAAESLADRAVARLRASSRHLAPIANIDALVDRLASHDFQLLKLALARPAAGSDRPKRSP